MRGKAWQSPPPATGLFRARLCVEEWKDTRTHVHTRRRPSPALQGYKAQLAGMGQWDAAMASLSQPAREKLCTMCQL